MTSQKVPTYMYHFQCQRISENNENLAVHGNYNYHDTGFLYKKLKETLSKIILEHRNILGVEKDHCPILSENCLIRTYIPHLHEEIIHLINVAWKWSFSQMHKTTIQTWLHSNTTWPESSDFSRFTGNIYKNGRLWADWSELSLFAPAVWPFCMRRWTFIFQTSHYIHRKKQLVIMTNT